MARAKHPAAAAAAEFDAGAQAPAPAPVPAAPELRVVPPAAPAAPVAQAPVPAAPAAPVASVPDLTPAPAPGTQIAQAPDLAPAELALLRAQLADANRLYEEAQARAAEIALERDTEAQALREAQGSLTSQLQALQQQLAERDARLASHDVDEILSLRDLSGTEHLSADAARELSDRVLRPVVTKLREGYTAELNRLRGDLTAIQRTTTQQLEGLTQGQQRLSRAQVNARIFDAHPDFDRVSKSPEWQGYLQQVAPGMRRSLGQEIADAYAEGDAAFVAQHIARFKQGRADPRAIADVQTVGSGVAATPAAPAVEQPKYQYSDLAEWRYQYQRGEIDRKRYQELQAAWKAAEREGRVK